MSVSHRLSSAAPRRPVVASAVPVAAPLPGERGWVGPLALAGAFLLLGLLTLERYGVSWDEPVHREWGRVAWDYLVTGDRALLGRFDGAGQYYGPLFYMLNYGVSHVAHEVLGMRFAASNHLVTLCTAAAGVYCTFRLAETLWSRAAGWAAAALLSLYPPFLAHAHYNPKDIPLLTLAAATLLFAARALRGGRDRDALLSGAFLGAAVAVKPTAVVLMAVVLGAIAADLLARRAPLESSLVRQTVLGAIAATASLFLTWPTLWRNPSLLREAAGYFGRGNFWEGRVLYFGELTLAAELPWHYTPVTLLMSIPVATVLLAAAGGARLVREATRKQHVFATALLGLGVVLPLVMFMKPGLPRYDGMRQIFFVLPVIAVLGGVGAVVLWTSLATKGRRAAANAGAVAVLAWLAIENVRVFPYGGSYVNEVARNALGDHLERRFEVEYWGVAYPEGMRWLASHAKASAVVCVPVASQVLLWQEELWRDDLVRDCDRAPDYVMGITRFSEWRHEYAEYRQRRAAYAVSRLGSDLLHIYEAR